MTISYEEAKSIAHDGDAKAREALASHDDIAPELLYFLAEDKAVTVRLAVAANPTAPMHADALLSRDADETVRAVLAEKIAGMAASGKWDSARLRELAHEALMVLAKDQVTRVRQVLSEALREVADVPPDVIRRLAWDVESIVSTPVLKFSPVLSDQDLIDIIRAKPSPGAVSAVSERDGVSGEVSDAIVETADTEAIALLLGNTSAQIREETLDRVIADAEKIDLWHMPLAMRPKLPSKAAVKIAQVVAEDALKRLQARNDLSIEATSAVRDIVLKRLGDGIALLPEDTGGDDADSGMRLDDDDIFDRAAADWAAGTLDEAALVRELNSGNIKFAKAIIAVMADVPIRIVERVRETQSAKGCVALSWRAGLTAKSSEIVQQKLGLVRPRDTLRAQGDRYPMSDDDLTWQLEFIKQL